jgi:hypothetical protein
VIAFWPPSAPTASFHAPVCYRPSSWLNCGRQKNLTQRRKGRKEAIKQSLNSFAPLRLCVRIQKMGMNVRPEDPVLTNARREALLVFAIWLAACIYSITVCYRLGYGRDITTLTYVFGFPDWVFWGVVVPWTVCTVLSFVLSYYVIRDDDLGAVQVEEHLIARAPETDRG